MDLAQPSSSHTSSDRTLTQTLIPGLPDDIAALILASIPYSHRCRLRPTSRAWYAFLSYASIAPLRRLLRLPFRHILCLFPTDPSVDPPFLFDPAGPAWAPLPPLPCNLYPLGLMDFATLSLGPHLYVLGGVCATNYRGPLRPFPSEWECCFRFVHRLDLSVSLAPHLLSWTRLPDMLFYRTRFACAPIARANSIIVAGGCPLTDMNSINWSFAEIFNVNSGEWTPISGPGHREEGFGFFLPQSQQKLKEEQEVEDGEFWVMGGYRSSDRPFLLNFDALVLGLRSRKWREVGDMWENPEIMYHGMVVVMDGVDGELLGVFMLGYDYDTIFRYDFGSNRWCKVSSLMRKLMPEESCGFVAMNGELCVLTMSSSASLDIQAYDPHQNKWRFFSTNPPFHGPINFRYAVSCTIQL